MIQWYYLSLISAVFSATAAITQKKILLKEKALSFAVILSIFNLVIIIPFFFLIDFSTLSIQGLLVLLVKSFLGAGSFVFVMLSIKNLEISKALPLLVLTPGLVAIFGFLLLGENLSSLEIIGLIIIMIGTYLVLLSKEQKIKDPFKEIIKSKAYYYVIAALILFTTTSLLDKTVLANFKVPVNAFIGFQHLFFAIFLIMFLFSSKEKKQIKKVFSRSWKPILLISTITIIYKYTYIYSVKLAPVALALSLKRISVFLAVVIGGKLFREHDLTRRIIATILLIAGILLIING